MYFSNTKNSNPLVFGGIKMPILGTKMASLHFRKGNNSSQIWVKGHLGLRVAFASVSKRGRGQNHRYENVSSICM